MITEHLDISYEAMSAGGIGIVFGLLILITTNQYRKQSWIHPIICINVILGYFVLLPLGYMILSGWQSQWYDQHYHWIMIALLILGMGYIELLLGHYVGSTIVQALLTNNRTRADGGHLHTHKHRSQTILTRLKRNQLNTTAVLVLGIIGFAAGLAFYYYYVTINGGFERLLTVQPRIAFQQIDNTARYRWLGKMGIYGGLVTIGIGLYDRIANTVRWYDALLSIVLIAISIAVAIGFRERLVILILGAYIVMYVYSSDLIQPWIIAGVGIAGIIGLVLFSAIESILLGGNVTTVLITSLLYTIRVDLFVGLLSRVPATHAFQNGATILAMIPIDGLQTSIVYGERMDMIFGGQTPHHLKSAMLIGELYLNFGVVGIIAGHMSIGFILGGLTVLFIDDDHEHMRHSWMYGLYPALILGLLSAYPTSIQWGLKMSLFMAVPPLTTIGVVLVVQRIVY